MAKAKQYEWQANLMEDEWSSQDFIIQMKYKLSYGDFPVEFRWVRTGDDANWALAYMQTRTNWADDYKLMSPKVLQLCQDEMRPHPAAVVQKLEGSKIYTRVVRDPRLGQTVPVSELAPDGWMAWCEDVSKMSPAEGDKSWYAHCRVLAADESAARRRIAQTLLDRRVGKSFRLAFLQADEPLLCLNDESAPDPLYLPDVIYDRGMVTAWIEGEVSPPDIDDVVEHFKFHEVPDWVYGLLGGEEPEAE